MSLPQIEPGAHKTILMVLPDREFTNQLSLPLKKSGFGVLVAHNGNTADMLLKTYFDQIVLLITDLVLPGKDGMYLIEEVINDDNLKNIPILVLTNLEDEKTEKKAKEFGVCDYLIKSKESVSSIINRVKGILALRNINSLKEVMHN